MTKSLPRVRPICRAAVIDGDRILLVRARNADYWHLPGGAWEPDSEPLEHAARREVLEETGYAVSTQKLFWVRQFRLSEHNPPSIELFWTATISRANTQREKVLQNHRDRDPTSTLCEARWFSEEDLAHITVKPTVFSTFSWLQNDQTDASRLNYPENL
ncbi:NUDIX domain-containing protein [Nocardia nova]